MTKKQLQFQLLVLIILYLSLSLLLYNKYYLEISKISSLKNFSKKVFQPSFKIQNILSDDKILRNKTLIKVFFIESHVNSERDLDNTRQACSVESAARLNPNSNIFFIFATNTNNATIKNSKLTQALSKYSNIYLRFLNPLEFSRKTFLEEFFHKKFLAKSVFHVENRANALRVLLLSKYGGTYLDLDIISLVPLEEIEETSYACAQSENKVNNAVMSFDGENGREILREYGKLLITDFKPNAWGANGPSMFSRVLKSICNITKFNEQYPTNCANFTILPTTKCYPIAFYEFEKFYEEKFKDEVMSRIEENESYFVHIWNKMEYLKTKSYKIRADLKSAYAELARRNCPRVFETVEDYF